MKITVSEVEALAAICPKPSNRSAFVDSVGGDYGRPEVDRPFWTGWKSLLNNYAAYLHPLAEVDIPDGPIGFVSQWVCFLKQGENVAVAYVNMPSMDAGIMPEGGYFKIGDVFEFADASPEQLESTIALGYHKLMELIAAEKSKAA